jgi:hypothetical protein
MHRRGLEDELHREQRAEEAEVGHHQRQGQAHPGPDEEERRFKLSTDPQFVDKVVDVVGVVGLYHHRPRRPSSSAPGSTPEHQPTALHLDQDRRRDLASLADYLHKIPMQATERGAD